MLSACSTVETMSKTGPMAGHVYSGVQLNFARWYCWSHTDTEKLSPWRTLGIAPYLIIDLPFSVVADTLYSPVKLSEDKGEGLGVLSDMNNCSKVKF